MLKGLALLFDIWGWWDTYTIHPTLQRSIEWYVAVERMSFL
jgi:hypothetical protein